MADFHWNGGQCYGEAKPASGLLVARMIGHITYLSEDALEHKFAQRLQDKTSFSYNFDVEFQIATRFISQAKSCTATIRFCCRARPTKTRAVIFWRKPEHVLAFPA